MAVLANKQYSGKSLHRENEIFILLSCLSEASPLYLNVFGPLFNPHLHEKFSITSSRKTRLFFVHKKPVRFVPHLHEQDVRARCSRENCLTFQRPEISERGQRHQLSDFSRKIDANVQPVYTSQKIKGQFKPKERKLPLVNQKNVDYYFKCGLCGGDWLHKSTLTSTCGGTQAINNRQPRKGCA